MFSFFQCVRQKSKESTTIHLISILVGSVEVFDGTSWSKTGSLIYPTYVFGSADNIPDKIEC